MKLISFKKKLSLFGAISVTVGAVIGVGIFVIVGEIGANSGPWMPVAFGLAAFLAIFGTMVAIALGSTIPADGGGFYYTKSLLGRIPGIAASWLIVIGALGSVAAVSLGVADYMRAYMTDSPEWHRPLIAIGIIFLTWAINSAGIMASEKFQIAMVVQLASALIIVIVVALVKGAHPDFSEPLPNGVGPFIQASVIAVMSFTGFNIIGELGDEIENPRRNVPLTIIIGLGIITFIYVGIGWVVAGTLGVDELKVSRVALLDTAMHHLPPWFKHYLNVAALAGAVTSINAVFLAVPREFTAQAEDGLLPEWIMRFNPERQTFPIGMGIVAVSGTVLVLFNFGVDIYSLLCVAGLILANVLFSIGSMRLFSLFPEKVATSPIKIKKAWLYPAAILSTIFSLGFGVLAAIFLVQEVVKALSQ